MPMRTGKLPPTGARGIASLACWLCKQSASQAARIRRQVSRWIRESVSSLNRQVQAAKPAIRWWLRWAQKVCLRVAIRLFKEFFKELLWEWLQSVSADLLQELLR